MKNALWVVLVVLFSFAVSTVDAEPMEFADSGNSSSVGRRVDEGPLVVLTASKIEQAGGIYFSSVTKAGDWFQLKLTANEGTTVLFIDARGNITTVHERRTLSIRSGFEDDRILAERRGGSLYIYPKNVFVQPETVPKEFVNDEFVGR